jgi:hypothetical protein
MGRDGLYWRFSGVFVKDILNGAKGAFIREPIKVKL